MWRRGVAAGSPHPRRRVGSLRGRSPLFAGEQSISCEYGDAQRCGNRASRTDPEQMQRSGQARRRHSLQVVLDRAAHHSRRPISCALTPSGASRSMCLNCRIVSSLFADIPFSSPISARRNASVADLGAENLYLSFRCNTRNLASNVFRTLQPRLKSRCGEQQNALLSCPMECMQEVKTLVSPTYSKTRIALAKTCTPRARRRVVSGTL